MDFWDNNLENRIKIFNKFDNVTDIVCNVKLEQERIRNEQLQYKKDIVSKIFNENKFKNFLDLLLHSKGFFCNNKINLSFNGTIGFKWNINCFEDIYDFIYNENNYIDFFDYRMSGSTSMKIYFYQLKCEDNFLYIDEIANDSKNREDYFTEFLNKINGE